MLFFSLLSAVQIHIEDEHLFIKSDDQLALLSINNFLNMKINHTYEFLNSFPNTTNIIKITDKEHSLLLGRHKKNFFGLSKIDFIFEYLRLFILVAKNFPFYVEFYIPDYEKDIEYITSYSHILIPIRIYSQKNFVSLTSLIENLKMKLKLKNTFSEQILRAFDETRGNFNYFRTEIKNTDFFTINKLDGFLGRVFCERNFKLYPRIYYYLEKIMNVEIDLIMTGVLYPIIDCKYRTSDYLFTYSYSYYTISVYVSKYCCDKYEINCIVNGIMYNINELSIQLYFITKVIMYSLFYLNIEITHEKNSGVDFYALKLKLTQSYGIEMSLVSSDDIYMILRSIVYL